MTENPSCCVPGDSVATAAQIMKREDVGPVLVVSDHATKRLVGIVTDRDLALKVVAEGRDSHSTRIDEVMSANPVTCRDDSEATEAVRLMADHQVRRIPIVDNSQRLVGIVAQADVARYADESQVGEMVEEISQPYGQGEWSGQLKAGGSGMSVFAAGAIGMGLGVGLMYLLDPSGGERRRTRLRQTTTDLYNTSSQAVQRTGAGLKEKVSSVRSRYGRGSQQGEPYPTTANTSLTDTEAYM
jgi:CBS domain-containing protein